MEDIRIITEAISLIKQLNSNFQVSKKGVYAELRVQENINDVLRKLHQSTKIDNSVLIALERFYQSTSMTIGLSDLKLNEEAFKSWKAYDKFHFDYVKSELKLYGPTVIL